MELSWTVVVVVAVFALIFGYVLGRRGGNVVTVSSEPPKTPHVRVSSSNVEDWEQEARIQLAAGNKIMAIKIAREKTGLGLKEAKDLVESWEKNSVIIIR